MGTIGSNTKKYKMFKSLCGSLSFLNEGTGSVYPNSTLSIEDIYPNNTWNYYLNKNEHYLDRFLEITKFGSEDELSQQIDVEKIDFDLSDCLNQARTTMIKLTNFKADISKELEVLLNYSKEMWFQEIYNSFCALVTKSDCYFFKVYEYVTKIIQSSVKFYKTLVEALCDEYNEMETIWRGVITPFVILYVQEKAFSRVFQHVLEIRSQINDFNESNLPVIQIYDTIQQILMKTQKYSDIIRLIFKECNFEYKEYDENEIFNNLCARSVEKLQSITSIESVLNIKRPSSQPDLVKYLQELKQARKKLVCVYIVIQYEKSSTAIRYYLPTNRSKTVFKNIKDSEITCEIVHSILKKEIEISILKSQRQLSSKQVQIVRCVYKTALDLINCSKILMDCVAFFGHTKFFDSDYITSLIPKRHKNRKNQKNQKKSLESIDIDVFKEKWADFEKISVEQVKNEDIKIKYIYYCSVFFCYSKENILLLFGMYFCMVKFYLFHDCEENKIKTLFRAMGLNIVNGDIFCVMGYNCINKFSAADLKKNNAFWDKLELWIVTLFNIMERELRPDAVGGNIKY